MAIEDIEASNTSEKEENKVLNFNEEKIDENQIVKEMKESGSLFSPENSGMVTIEMLQQVLATDDLDHVHLVAPGGETFSNEEKRNMLQGILNRMIEERDRAEMSDNIEEDNPLGSEEQLAINDLIGEVTSTLKVHAVTSVPCAIFENDENYIYHLSMPGLEENFQPVIRQIEGTELIAIYGKMNMKNTFDQGANQKTKNVLNDFIKEEVLYFKVSSFFSDMDLESYSFTYQNGIVTLTVDKKV